MIPGDILSAFPHRQFHTLPGLLDSWAALQNSFPNALRAMQGGSLYHFYDGLWYDPAERRTHDLPCERRTRYRLSQPNTVCCLHWHYKWNLTINKWVITIDDGYVFICESFYLITFWTCKSSVHFTSQFCDWKCMYVTLNCTVSWTRYSYLQDIMFNMKIHM